MMARREFLLTTPAFVVSGCGISESRLNPFNWFRAGPENTQLDPFEVVVFQDSRPLVREITSLTIDRTPGGAIIRVTGLPPEQGWYDAGLVSETGDGPADGVISYSLRARAPFSPTRISTRQSRELSVAAFISDDTLSNITTIRVTGATNSRTARR